MDRRHLLARFGAVLGTASLGGCLERYRDVAGETGDETTEGTITGETAGGRPTLADKRFEVTDSNCGDPANQASVEFDSAASSVAVTGTIGGSNACYTAKLASASYDPDAGSFDVTVVSKEKEGADVCSQCLVEIDYRARFDFDGGLPGTVTVVHEAMGESETVVRAQSG